MSEYKLRLPVLLRKCANCGLDYTQHADKKCLFDSSEFKPGRVTVSKRTVKCPTNKPKEKK